MPNYTSFSWLVPCPIFIFRMKGVSHILLCRLHISSQMNSFIVHGWSCHILWVPLMDKQPTIKGLGLVFGVWCLEFGSGVWGLVLGVWCLESDVWGLVFVVWCLEFRVWCLGPGVWSLVFGAWCLGSGIWGLVFGIWCLETGVVVCVCGLVFGAWCLEYVVWSLVFRV